MLACFNHWAIEITSFHPILTGTTTENCEDETPTQAIPHYPEITLKQDSVHSDLDHSDSNASTKCTNTIEKSGADHNCPDPISPNLRNIRKKSKKNHRKIRPAQKTVKEKTAPTLTNQPGHVYTEAPIHQFWFCFNEYNMALAQLCK